MNYGHTLQRGVVGTLLACTVCISYNTPSRDLARIYARCTRARSARGQRPYIPAESRRRGVIDDL